MWLSIAPYGVGNWIGSNEPDYEVLDFRSSHNYRYYLAQDNRSDVMLW